MDLILGSSALDLMEAVKPAVFGPPGGPVAKFTRLGWIVGGRTVLVTSKTQKKMNLQVELLSRARNVSGPT